MRVWRQCKSLTRRVYCADWSILCAGFLRDKQDGDRADQVDHPLLIKASCQPSSTVALYYRRKPCHVQTFLFVWVLASFAQLL